MARAEEKVQNMSTVLIHLPLVAYTFMTSLQASNFMRSRAYTPGPCRGLICLGSRC